MTRPNYARRRLAALILATATAAGAVNAAPTVWEWADDPNALSLVDEAGATESTVFPTLFTPGDCASFRFIASQVWPEIDTPAGPAWAWVKKVMWRESRCQPEPEGRNDRNRCGQQSWGLLQVRFTLRTSDCADIYWDVDMRTGFPPLNVACNLTDKRELLNPAKNLECARWLFMAFGYKPWRA